MIAGLTTFGLYYFSYGLVALRPLATRPKMVISPTIWRGGPGDRPLARQGRENMVTT